MLAAAASSAFLVLPACGGGGGSDSNTSNSSGNGSSSSTGGTDGTGSGSTGGASSDSGGGSSAGCTVVGGALIVAAQGPIGATLLSNGGATGSFEVELGYSLCDVNCHAPQQQDAFAFAFGAKPPLFDETTPVGTSFSLQPQTGIAINGQMASTFPKGTPIFLVFRIGDDFGETANTKDLGRAIPDTAVVSYSAGSTATVDFRTSGGLDYRVGLTNVVGSAGACSA
jgi:hypothetical protein